MNKLDKARRSFGGVKMDPFDLELIRRYFRAGPGRMYFGVEAPRWAEPYRVVCHYQMDGSDYQSFVVSKSWLQVEADGMAAKLNSALAKEDAWAGWREVVV